MSNRNRRTRTGGVAIETAIVLPVLVLIILGIILVGMNVFAHQQVAFAAREAARYACVRGGDFQVACHADSPTQQQILDNAVLPRLVGLDPQGITVTVEWIDRGADAAYAWDASDKSVRSISSTGEYVSNEVRVTVTYRTPGSIFGSSQSVRGRCTMPMHH